MTLLEVLDELGVPVGNDRGEWVNVSCPWCGKPGKPGMGINKQSLAASCWSCGLHRVGDVLAAASGRPLGEVLSLLSQARGTLPREERPKGRLRLPMAGPLAPAHRNYLLGRGFDPDKLARLWGLRGIGVDPRWGWRILIPITKGGREVSWTTRAIGNAKPKYRSAPPSMEAIPAKSLLYGWDYVWHAAVVVEGPADAWRVGPGAVATLGTTWTQGQLRLLAGLPLRVVCFDTEPEAQRRAAALCRALEGFPGRTVNAVLEKAGDPGEAGEDEIMELREFLDQNSRVGVG